MPATAASPGHRAPIRSTQTVVKPSHSASSMAPYLSPPVASSDNSHPRPPQTPSPNYFGNQDDADSFMSDHARHTKHNWSPPSSAVRSTAAASPTAVPLDQHSDYDEFRRQSKGNSLNLSALNNFHMHLPTTKTTTATGPRRSMPSEGNISSPRPTTEPREFPIRRTTPPNSSTASYRATLDPSTAELSRSPKRVLSPGSAYHSARRGSPASFAGQDSERHEADEQRSAHAIPRFDLSNDVPVDAHPSSHLRSETLPANQDSDPLTAVSPQFVVNLLQSKAEEILLLDLRVATQYAASHINGALNLCIPTTLLKRSAFNVQKLAETFRYDEQRSRFQSWRNSSYIVVYDGHSSIAKDATICLNTIKKFRGENYGGTACFIKGGFNEFSKRFPNYVESAADASNSSALSSPNAPHDSATGDASDMAPVIGGCPLPSTDQPINPFFGNIRQNMDLIAGVGQIPLKHPAKASQATEANYPAWLKQAANEGDEGKQVSFMFEQIERREKKRMEDALSSQVSYGNAKPEKDDAVQIAGLEKGNKNRYNNIWPFEHSRVKLQGVPSSGCDYFNASHIQASWSNKRYISTQAPIPGTFNDFWNVIWQQDVRVIVMLTAEKEGAQVKAHNYWGEKQYGSLHLDALSEKRASIEPERIHKHLKRLPINHRVSSAFSYTSAQATQARTEGPATPNRDDRPSEQPYVTVRKFTLSHDRFPFEQMREITQLQYSSWPDFGAPAHPAHLLGLVEQCDAVVRATNKTSISEPEPPNNRPVLVHCSAGCGRTGTFCTVDSVIDMLKRQRLSQTPRVSVHLHKDGSPVGLKQNALATPSQNEISERKGFFNGTHSARNGDGNQNDGSNRLDVAEDEIDGDWVQRGDRDLVEKTVEDFRLQRLSMVQSLRQYVLCYESVMEWLVGQSIITPASGQ